MKIFMVLILISFSLVTYSKDYPVMLNIKSDVTIPNDFRDGVEESLTKMGYSLVDEKAQEEAIIENAKARNSECYDDECLVDTGKMLAARALISVEVDKKSETAFKFKGRLVDFETGTTTKTKVMYYEHSLNDFKKLSTFGKYFSSSLIDKKEKKEKKETHNPLPYSNYKKPKNSRYAGKWDITLGLQGLYHEYRSDYQLVNTNDTSVDYGKYDDESTTGALLGAGLELGITFRVSHWLAFYFDGSFLIASGDVDYAVFGDLNDSESYKKEDTVLASMVTVGTQFSFGDTNGKGLVYYLRAGVSLGLDTYSDIEKINTIGVTAELGVNVLLSPNNFIDIYIGADYLDYQSSSYAGRQIDEYDKPSDLYRTFFSGYSSNITLGVRYNLFTF